MEVGDTTVHELQKDLQVLVPGAIEDHDQLPVERRVLEQLGEVGAAGGKDQPVGLEGLAFAKEGHITQSFGVEESLKRGEYVGFVGIPP